jgi:hypothetical protein
MTKLDRQIRESYLAMIRAEHTEDEGSWLDYLPGVLVGAVIVLIAVACYCAKGGAG